jgi:uncharacterized FlaG/YvyC family protein
MNNEILLAVVADKDDEIERLKTDNERLNETAQDNFSAAVRWQEESERLTAEVERLNAELSALKRRVEFVLDNNPFASYVDFDEVKHGWIICAKDVRKAMEEEQK